MEAPITRTCKWLSGAALVVVAASPATASTWRAPSDPARAYIEARAAGMNGEHARSADLLATIAQSTPGEPDVARKALTEALGAGRMDLALQLARSTAATKLPSDARLLLVADELRRKRPGDALRWLAVTGESGDLQFLAPLINAWSAADAGDATRALAALDQIPANSLLGPLRAEHRAYILLKLRRTAEAETFARRAIGSAGAREGRIRVALADGFLAAGDRARALAMVEGPNAAAAAVRTRIATGRVEGENVDTAAKALSEALTAFGGDLARLQRGVAPVGLVQVARYANPANSSATALVALLLDAQDRSPEALALLQAVRRDDPLIAQVRDIQVKLLNDNKQFPQAFAIASAAAAMPGASSGDFSRLGDVYAAMKRHADAADAYGRAVATERAQGPSSELWTLLLLRASALEDAGRWPEAKQALEEGLVIAPDQPLLLNFLGYGKLERKEDMDGAEAMIRKASELAPDDASITDSLGWAEYKRGKLTDSIATLQRAAEKDPDQAEIHEHLGDALYKSGRRFEARFAWEASLITAEDDIAKRVRAKLISGMSEANAAP
ncbi:MAG: tetratricopeptide repeat protein [Sphingomicrobium sp.]